MLSQRNSRGVAEQLQLAMMLDAWGKVPCGSIWFMVHHGIILVKLINS